MKLNIGCGTIWLPGFVNVDYEPWEALQARAREQDKPDELPACAIFRQLDLREELPFEDGSASEVVAEQILEHFNQVELYALLRELARVVEPGGKMVGATPDIEAVFGLYQRQDPCAWDADAAGGIFGTPWQNLLDNMAHGWGHKIMFTPPMLEHVLNDAGFVATVSTEEPCTLRFVAVRK